MDTKTSRIVRLLEVQRKTGLGRSSVYKYMGEGSFPKSITLGPRAIGWLESDIDRWIAERVYTSLGK